MKKRQYTIGLGEDGLPPQQLLSYVLSAAHAVGVKFDLHLSVDGHVELTVIVEPRDE